MTVAALALHCVALFTWISLRKRIEVWVYWAVLTGFVMLFTHRIVEVSNCEPFPFFSHLTAVGIAGVALTSVFQTRRYLQKQGQVAIALETLHKKLEHLASEVTLREPIAAQIAEIMADLRAQIRYYEKQAKDHDLPLFH